MAKTRYREVRILVRGLCRLKGESREEFKRKVVRLRRHFEQFNVYVSELCQWLMGLRPSGKGGGVVTKEFWEFFLEPERFLKDDEKEESDRCRRIVFDIAAGLEGKSSKSDVCLSQAVVDSACEVGRLPLTLTTARLFERVGALDASSRQVLLKAGAEWVIVHYLRGHQNWERQREEWEKEKAKWEREHPELTKSVREDLNGHEVYFGTDEAAVSDADRFDGTGIYRGNTVAGPDPNGRYSYSVPETLDLGQYCYWRIDEVNESYAGPTPPPDGRWKGYVWEFRVAEIAGDEPPRIGGERKLEILKWGAAYYFQFIREKFCWR